MVIDLMITVTGVFYLELFFLPAEMAIVFFLKRIVN